VALSLAVTALLNDLGSLWQAEVVEGVFDEEVRGLPAAPSALDDTLDVVDPGVVRIQNQKSNIAGGWVEINTQQTVRQLATADHDWSALGLEVQRQFASVV